MVHFTPSVPLKPYIHRFTIAEASGESVYKVLPGNGVVIGFQFRGKLYHVHDGKDIALSPSGITGICDAYRIFKTSAGIGTLLVYFKDGTASAFFREPIHTLFRRSVALDNLVPRPILSLLEEQLSEADTHQQRIKRVEQFLVSHMKGTGPDLLVGKAMELIDQSGGNLKMSVLANQLHISQSPLEKRFRKVVGASPKKFASIVRFRNILTNGFHSSLTGIGLDAGFYDQSHFIREFKRFTGDTPEHYFKLR